MHPVCRPDVGTYSGRSRRNHRPSSSKCMKSGPIMSFELLRGPIHTLRWPPYELRGSLRRSVNPFRRHQSTCRSLQTIPSGTLRVPSEADRTIARLKGRGAWPHGPLWFLHCSECSSGRRIHNWGKNNIPERRVRAPVYCWPLHFN